MNTGQIVRAKSEKAFTMLSNKLLQDCSITIEEKGLLVYLLSLPTDWVLYKKSLPEKTNESKGAIDRVFKQLQEKGYILSVKVIDPQTKVFKGWNHIVYEEPTLTEPDIREKPTSGFADLGQSMPIQRHTNTNTNINTNTNTTTLAKKPKNSFVPPTLEEVKVFFRDKGFREDAAIKAFNYYTDGNWHDKSGSPVRNWRLKMHVWFKDGYKIQEEKIKVRDVFGSTHFKTQDEINKAEKGFFNKI
jgi:hypothetical protein